VRGEDDHQCDLGLQCTQSTNAKGLNIGTCTKLIEGGKACEVRGSDGVSRLYKCEPGYKCSRRVAGETRQCYRMHELADGESS